MLLLLCLLAAVPTISAQCVSSTGRPTVKRSISPDYPDRGRLLGLKGKISLRITVLPDGTAGKVDVVHGFGYGMDEAAQAAASKFLFSTCCAECSVPVEFNFSSGGSPRRLEMGSMIFELEKDVRAPMLKVSPEPDLSGSLAAASDGELEFTVTAEGDPVNFRVTSHVEPIAEKSILHAFAQLKFAPARNKGTATEARGHFQFHINP